MLLFIISTSQWNADNLNSRGRIICAVAAIADVRIQRQCPTVGTNCEGNVLDVQV